MTFYNPYSQIYTTMEAVLSFKANGLISVEETKYLNIMDRYYNFDNSSHVFRLLFEICYFIILIVYITIEVKAIMKHIKHNFEAFKKEQDHLEMKEQRIKDREARQKQLRMEMLKQGENPGAVDVQEEDDSAQDFYVGEDSNVDDSNNNQAAKKMQEMQEMSQKAIMTYGVGIIRFVPMGLKDHFNDIWNLFDVVIFGLASITVPIWINFIVRHSRIFKNKPSIAFDEALRLKESSMGSFMFAMQMGQIDLEDFSKDILTASQNNELYALGEMLQTYQ